ncbi:hypothetical protein [uncultured Roseibium sp.]|uniref:hypothetical protein n=1 Tax=uncultured Roseibium sp. TaxID=1936171 RepID=UPI0026170476|nr:hypothetical protein [uncultured Roseibium sp.]
MELDRLVVSRVIAQQFEAAAQKGVRLQMSRDFALLESLLEQVPEKGLTEHFRRNLNTYSPQQAFWLGGFNQLGELVGLAAARLDQLGSWSLEKYWREYWSRCYPDAEGSPVQMSDRQYRFAKGIRGDVVYLGEMWVAKQHAVDGVSGPFSKAILLLSLLEWQFQAAYAWVRPAFLERGFAFKCGFTSTHPGIIWEKGPATIDPDLHVMASSRSDLFDLVDLLSCELPEALSSSKST